MTKHLQKLWYDLVRLLKGSTDLRPMDADEAWAEYLAAPEIAAHSPQLVLTGVGAGLGWADLRTRDDLKKRDDTPVRCEPIPEDQVDSSARSPLMTREWLRAGSHPKEYYMGPDPDSRHQVLCLLSRVAVASGFGTLMQFADAGRYRGRRVRFSAFVRTEGVSSWTGLWLRIDGRRRSQKLGFDNMGNRPIRGTTAWAEYSCVLDVPEASRYLAYGVLLSGVGKVWFSVAKIEEVGLGVPTTRML